MLDAVLRKGPLGFVSMGFYKEEMTDRVCSTMWWPNGTSGFI